MVEFNDMQEWLALADKIGKLKLSNEFQLPTSGRTLPVQASGRERETRTLDEAINARTWR